MRGMVTKAMYLASAIVSVGLGCNTPRAPALSWVENCNTHSFAPPITEPDACAVAGEHTTLGAQLFGTDVVIAGQNFDDGIVIAGGGSAATTANRDVVLRIPVGAALGKLSIADVFTSFKKLDLGVTFSVGGTELHSPPLGIYPHILDSFWMVTRGPMPFGDEHAPPPAKHTVVIASLSTSNYAKQPLVGPAATLADIDWVAIRTDGPKHPLGTCQFDMTTYRGQQGSNTSGVSIPQIGDDATFTIYERRSGKVIDRKDFVAGPAPCPDVVNGGGDIHVPVDIERVREYLFQRIAS